VDFSTSDRTEAIRAEARAFVAEHVTADVIRRSLDTGTMHDWGLHRALAAKHWIAPTWPVAEGGLGMAEIDALTIVNEFFAAGAPIDGGWITTMCAANALRSLASDEQKQAVLPRVVAGEALLCLGFSEPDCGSDVSAARTRAVRDGDGWIINGQKMFTTMAHEASWVILLTRTDPTVAPHQGLTMFLVPLNTPGITVDPVHTLGSERTNVTFYSDVRVPDEAVLGEVGGGWRFLTHMLTEERGSAFGGGVAFLGTMRQVLDGTRGAASETHRRDFARAAIDREVAELLNLRSIWLATQGRDTSVEAAVAKLFSTEALNRMASGLIETLGPAGLLDYRSPDAAHHGEVEHAFRHAPVTTILGGTSEILRSVIGQRGLGLPRG
jgi:alkylation response protein AidB-like acyl-CoA dehydrogenase